MRAALPRPDSKRSGAAAVTGSGTAPHAPTGQDLGSHEDGSVEAACVPAAVPAHRKDRTDTVGVNDPEDIFVSPQALERMREELEELTGQGRQSMGERLLRARELGDLKENAEYHSAKDAQGLMEARIRQLQHTLSNAVVREAPASSDIVAPGLIVTVADGAATEDYLFAGSMEEKVPGASTVTPSSPMGRALTGRRVGETVVIQAPAGSFSVQIVGLRPA